MFRKLKRKSKEMKDIYSVEHNHDHTFLLQRGKADIFFFAKKWRCGEPQRA